MRLFVVLVRIIAIKLRHCGKTCRLYILLLYYSNCRPVHYKYYASQRPCNRAKTLLRGKAGFMSYIFVQIVLELYIHNCNKDVITPPPVGGRGIVFGHFRAISFFLCQQHYEKTEIFMEGVE